MAFPSHSPGNRANVHVSRETLRTSTLSIPGIREIIEMPQPCAMAKGRLLRVAFFVVRRVLQIVWQLLVAVTVVQAQYYVAPDGNDTTNPGTLDQPFKTLLKAHSVVAAGDTIFIRGGLYDSLTVTINLSKDGDSTNRIYLLAYENERPLLNFSLMAESTSNRGIRISGDYWHVKGLDIKGAGDNGMHISGSHNIVEFCSFFENRDTGLQIGNDASYNQIINCDSYHNADAGQGNADGFAAKLDVGTGNSFYGCRAWENSDDGYDGYLRPADSVVTTLTNCWIFRNGYLKNGTASVGNGNGFKLGGGDNGNADSLRHIAILKNCLAFDNRVKGFDQNNNRGSMTLLNCTAFRNGSNYGMPAVVKSGETVTLTNCAVLGIPGSIWGGAMLTTNSWMSPFVVTSDDFVSTDTSGVRGPRKADGSLPDIAFMNLAEGSDLIDGGTDVGIPYYGSAPDLGAFETGAVISAPPLAALPQDFVVAQNYPNPFNPATNIVYEIPGPGTVSIRIVDLIGREIQETVIHHSAAGTFTAQWDGTNHQRRSVASGIYFAVVHHNGHRAILKLQLLR